MSDKKIDDGGEAFPQPMFVNPATHMVDWPSNGWGAGGMTLRDYFAAKAMVAMIDARASLPEDDPCSLSWALACGVGCPMPNHIGPDDKPLLWNYDVAIDAYSIADAMLAARKVRP